MSTKTTFKRIALVAVAALGLGVLSVAPSSAGVTVGSETLTLSAASQTVNVGDTASTTITVNFTTLVATESVGVVVLGTGATGANEPNGSMGGYLYGQKSDSINATMSSVDSGVVTGVTNGYLYQAYITQSAAGNVVQGKFRLDITNVSVVGTHIYSITTRAKDGSVSKSATFTVTVAPKDTVASAVKTQMWVNQTYVDTETSHFSDSALVVSAGTVANAGTTAVGYILADMKNASDTNVVTGSPVTGSLIVSISGPGFLTKRGSTVMSKSVTLTYGDTATIWSDGTPGTSTISGVIGTTALTQAAKTLKFTGKATSFVATANSITAAGYNLNYVGDSVTAGTAIVTFLATDSSGNAVGSSALNANTFYAFSSDTSVVRAVNSNTLNYQACTAVAGSTTGKWTCNMNVLDSGTVTITIADSFTVASAPYKSSAVSITLAGAARTGTIAFDKASYAPGEKAIITITAKDRSGRAVGQTALAGSAADPFTDIQQNKAFSSGAFNTNSASWTMTGSTFVNGVETVIVYMPVTGGNVTLTGYTNYDSSTVNTPVSVSVAVVDAQAAAAAAAAATATAAAKDASDAATDAALEATDAAYAATDAANIAAEAADAATAAAEAATEAANAAKESADAATAAVEELATSVAKLMAALQAQITTLAKVVAKIAVKVKA